MRTLLALALTSTAALAQGALTAPPQQTPGEQALSERLLAEMNYGLQCRQASIAMQAEIEKLKAELKALKEPASGPSPNYKLQEQGK